MSKLGSENSIVFIPRTILLENETNKSRQIIPVNCAFDICKTAINLKTTFENRHLSFQHLRGSQLFYEHQKLKCYLGIYPFQEDSFIIYENWSCLEIKITYKNPQNVNAISQSPLSESRKRNKEKTLKQVQIILEEWAAAVQQSKSGNKNKTLQVAAKEIGLPKKTIEDYFRYFKIASSFEFDFKINQNQKMGTLRNFVKKNLKWREENGLKNQEAAIDTDIYWSISCEKETPSQSEGWA